MKNAWKAVIIILSLAVVCLILATVITVNSLRLQPDTHKNNPSQEFQMDYQIDLKQDRYIIIDESGDRHVVLFGDLEQFFIRDNL